MDRRDFIKLTGALAAGVLPTTNASLGIPSHHIMASDVPAHQWQPVELRFRASHHYAKPWSQVRISADFTGPTGQTFHVHGFWDGGDMWAIRFSPTEAGRWSYRVECNVADAGLKSRAGVFDALAATDGNPLHRHGGFLHVSPDHHYLTYSDGTPFFWLGDTWWFCPSSLVPFNHSDHRGIPSMYKALVNKRHSQGFTIAQMAFIGSLGVDENVRSFMNLLKGGKFNMRYWHKVDAYIQYANNAGIIPAIILDWHYPAMPTYSLEQWKFLWRYFVARYGAHAVTWLVCGEYNSPHTEVAQVLRIGEFIKQCDPYKRAMSVHPWWFVGDKHQAWSQPWYDFIMFQGAHLGHDALPPTSIYTDAWRHEPPKPIIQGECNYEGIRLGINGTTVTAGDVRRTACQAIQAGCCGYTYGANGLWYPTQGPSDRKFWKDWGKSPPWWVAMNDPGAQQMAHLKHFYGSFAWWKTVPRPNAVVLAKPPGIASRPATGTQPGTPPEITRANGQALGPLVRAEGNRLFIVWFPQSNDAKVSAWLLLSPSRQNAVFSGRWFHPRTGKNAQIVRQIKATCGRCLLPDRPNNEDWVLVLSRV